MKYGPSRGPLLLALACCWAAAGGAEPQAPPFAKPDFSLYRSRQVPPLVSGSQAAQRTEG